MPTVFVKFFRFKGKSKETALIEEAHSGQTHEVQTVFLYRVADAKIWEATLAELRSTKSSLNSSVNIGELIRELKRDARHATTIDAVLTAARRLVPAMNTRTDASV